jgi:ABC-type transport system substrate-binding protein
LAAGLAGALTIAACGSDDGGGDSGGDDTTADTEAPAETEAAGGDEVETEDTTAEGAEDVETEGGDTDGDTGSEGVEAEGDVDTDITEEGAERSYGGDVIIGLEAEATGLRPWEDVCSSPCYNMTRSVFDSLTEQRADGTYGPYLAEEVVPNADFTEWTATLRPDVTFHDGTPFNAQTLVDMFAIQQNGQPSSSPRGKLMTRSIVPVTSRERHCERKAVTEKSRPM